MTTCCKQVKIINLCVPDNNLNSNTVVLPSPAKGAKLVTSVSMCLCFCGAIEKLSTGLK